MLGDDHMDYEWVFAFSDTPADNAAQTILGYCTTFGVPEMKMSDGPTHFKNETVRMVCENLEVPHHVTLSDSPWNNGAVERLGKELLRVLRSICS